MKPIHLPKFFYGGDYNPEQWSRETWDEDMRLFKMAGINMATIAVFSWARLQPSEDKFDFSWLDELMDLLHKNDISVCLATSTAAQPAWLSKKYPEILPVNIHGMKKKHGMRMNFCPNSHVFRKATHKMASAMAQRYQNHPALFLWHVSNEYGPNCYCDTCAKAFRDWLKKRYGTIDELNKKWYDHFWGHTFYDWDEIEPASYLTEEFQYGEKEGTCFQGISLDYRRFMSDSNLACYLNEKKALNEITPNIPVTTNLMGFFKSLNYFDWAPHLDIIAWDNYPSNIDNPGTTAMKHDLMRSLKGNQPFLLMEQTPSRTNWQAYNALKKPGVLRLWSYQAMAHGADSIMYFQLRKSRGACEKYHGAVIDHVGHENTRVFQECKQLGEELLFIGKSILGSRTQAKVGILFDWENWWASEFSGSPSMDMKYIPQIEKYYQAFYRLNIPIDFLPEEGDFSNYKLIIAPLMYMVKSGVGNRLEKFVQNGGVFLTTFYSGIVDENDLVTLKGYPGDLRKLLGIWVEEIDALFPNQTNKIVFKKSFGSIKGAYSCRLLCDLLHTESAKTLAVFGDDFYKGMPAITENSLGKGKAYYIASDPEQKFLDKFIREIIKMEDIQPVLSTPEGVEVTRRVKGNQELIFMLNHNPKTVQINLGKQTYQDLFTGKNCKGKIPVAGYDTRIFMIKY